jgi:DNA polymerase-3 subunit gamma/tau
LEENEERSSWYNKWRPKTLEEYSGRAIKDIVEKRFTKRANMPQVIFIQGTRGCGKTTLSRILSKYYLCQNFTEEGPCGHCEMCEAIDEILIGGNSSEVECPGVTELAADRFNTKEAVQEILEDAMQPPIYTEYKVVIIDEVHELSKSAQTSMLKILEEPPKHLIVIMATTNPEKVLNTILSRCQLILTAKKQTISDMADRLMTISEQEGLTVSREALEIIAKAGGRVPRDCIKILESIAKTYGNEVTVDRVKDYVGETSSDLYLQYFKAANRSLADILEFVKGVQDKDINMTQFVSGMMEFVMDAMYIKFGISFDEYTADYIKSIKELFTMYNSSEFDTLLQIVEYLTNHITKDEDNRNALLLVTTAMRIGKINLLANGLAEEQSESIAENKISVYEHSKKLKSNNAEVIEQTKMNLDLQMFKEEFEDSAQVLNTGNLLNDVKIPYVDIDATNEDTTENTNSDDEVNEVDAFFQD